MPMDSKIFEGITVEKTGEFRSGTSVKSHKLQSRGITSFG